MIEAGFIDVAWPRLALRITWIVLRIALVLALAHKGTHFFYQGF